SPYIGVRPPPAPAVWAHDLTVRLRDLGVMVLDVTLTAAEVTSDSPGGARPAIHQTQSRGPADRVIHLAEDGDEAGQTFDSMGSGAHVDQWPTVFIIDRDEVVRAVLEGQQAWDAAAIERAARRVAPGRAPNQVAPAPPT